MAEDDDVMSWDEISEGEEEEALYSYLNQTDAPSAAELDLLATTSFREETNDCQEVWFYGAANRDVAQRILEKEAIGTFFVRPSSNRGCYATSYVADSGRVEHQIIYALFPGFTMDEVSSSGGAVYDTIGDVVRACPKLKHPLKRQEDVSKLCAEEQTTQGVGLVRKLVELMQSNNPLLSSLSWKLSRSTSNVGAMSRTAPSVSDDHTHIHYCLEHHKAAGLLSMQGSAARAIFSALAHNRTIVGVKLEGYRNPTSRSITANLVDGDVRHLARALCRNKTLTSINLACNRITDDGARYLAEGLKRNTSVRHVDLSSNFVSHRGIRELAKALARNRHIDQLVVQDQLARSLCPPFTVLLSSPEFSSCRGLIDESLTRKRELAVYASPHSAIARGGGRHWSCPFQGYLTRRTATKLLRGAVAGTYFFYLNRAVTNVLVLAVVHDNGKVGHHQVYRAIHGYSLRREKAHEDVSSLRESCLWLLSSVARAERPDDPEEFVFAKGLPGIVEDDAVAALYLPKLWSLREEALSVARPSDGIYATLHALVSKNRGLLRVAFHEAK